MSQDMTQPTDAQNAPEIAHPNCPEHDATMRWADDREAYYCPEPCGWEFHI